MLKPLLGHCAIIFSKNENSIALYLGTLPIADHAGNTSLMKSSWLGYSIVAVLLSGFFGVAALVIDRQQQPVAIHSVSAEVAKQNVSSAPAQDDLSPIAEEIQALLDAWQGGTLASSGWLHVVEMHDRTKSDAGHLPNGGSIPIDYISETWYFVQDGQVMELVAFMKALDGSIIQASTYQDGAWRNLTTGDAWQAQADPFNLDFGFIQDVLNSDLYGSQVTRKETEDEIAFSIQDEFPQAVQLEGYDFLVIRAQRKLLFDKRTGELLSVERIFETPDGVEHRIEQITILSVEKASPPPEVLNLLEGG